MRLVKRKMLNKFKLDLILQILLTFACCRAIMQLVSFGLQRGRKMMHGVGAIGSLMIHFLCRVDSDVTVIALS